MFDCCFYRNLGRWPTKHAHTLWYIDSQHDQLMLNIQQHNILSIIMIMHLYVQKFVRLIFASAYVRYMLD